MTDQPTIVFSMGDAAGVGPQVLAAAWREPRLWRVCRPLVVGSSTVMRRAVEFLGLELQVVEVAGVHEAAPAPGLMPCWNVLDEQAAAAPPGVTSSLSGQASLEAVRQAVRLVRDGQAAALVTLPINKAAWAAAGGHWPGHTELLADLCETSRSAMLLYLPPEESSAPAAAARRHGLGVVHVTLHMALREVAGVLTAESIVWRIGLLDQALRRLTRRQANRPPRLAVCAFNPHAGEEGLFGDEEQRIIEPAVRQAQGQGIQVQGPLPADTLWMRAVAGEFDGVVAMYHDQGHIALKMLGVHQPVNVTLGLPIVRTSVAHGTAYDRAWKLPAEHLGLLQAAETAAALIG